MEPMKGLCPLCLEVYHALSQSHYDGDARHL